MAMDRYEQEHSNNYQHNGNGNNSHPRNDERQERAERAERLEAACRAVADAAVDVSWHAYLLGRLGPVGMPREEGPHARRLVEAAHELVRALKALRAVLRTTAPEAGEE